jgi:hypothetical protein
MLTQLHGLLKNLAKLSSPFFIFFGKKIINDVDKVYKMFTLYCSLKRCIWSVGK